MTTNRLHFIPEGGDSILVECSSDGTASIEMGITDWQDTTTYAAVLTDHERRILIKALTPPKAEADNVR